MTLSDSLASVARAAMALSGSVATSPDRVIPSLPVGRRRCSSLRSSPFQMVVMGTVLIQADRLTSRMGKRSESGAGRPGESSLSCRQQIRSTHISGAKAATERSEGVADAKRE